MIEKICTDIRTFFETDANEKEFKPTQSKSSKKINQPLRLAKNARVMITKNICVNDGLANGVTGRILQFVENDNKEVSRIIIKCDSPKVGKLHRVSCSHCHGQDTVCVTRESNTIDRLDFDLHSKKGTKQFPLRLSWTMTIHKAQGITVDQVVISSKDLFGSGMGYTALSRVRTLQGLFLIDLHFDKFYCNENVDRVLSQMKRIKKKSLVFQNPSKFLNILFHNIEGLKCNFNAFRNHHLTHAADLICLAETWLNDDTDLNQLQLNGYHVLHRTRSSSFAPNHLLHTQKGGGVAVYYRETVPIKRIDSSKDSNLEYMNFEIEKDNILIFICYRSPQQSKNEFTINLTEHLKQINNNKKILLIGDFNENALHKESKPIETNLKNLGFVNIFKDLPTTNSLTSLDCIYSNFSVNGEQYRDVTGTFYSFHDALIYSVNTENEKFDSNKKNELDDDENMETDSILQTSLSLLEKSNKRKKNSTEKKSNKSFKKDKYLTNSHHS